MMQYVSECSMWSVGGLVLGYVLGHVDPIGIRRKKIQDDDS